MQILLLILTVLLLIPAALAGIASGVSQLIADWGDLGAQLDAMAQVAQPLWLAGQSLLAVLTGLVLLVVAAALLLHALKSRP